MPLIATVAAIGVAGAAAAGAVDPPGIAAWGSGFFGTIATWLPTNTVILPGTIVSAAGIVSGTGVFSFAARDLGIRIAAAVGSVDAPGKQKWTAIGETILKHFEDNGKAVPIGFTAPPLGGPVVGLSGTVLCPNPGLGLSLADAAGSKDAIGAAGWAAIAALLLSWWQSSITFLATPIGLVAPPSGPVTGAGTIL